MKINKPQLSDLKSKPIHQLFTKGILDTLKDGEPAKIEGDNGSFDFYKNGDNDFGVSFNSMGVEFKNNPMPTSEMQEILHPLISTAANFEDKLPHDLLLRLRDMFFQKKGNEKEWNNFDGDVLFKNISLESVISKLNFQKDLLKDTESIIQQGIILYLDAATKYIDSKIKSFPENSIMREKLLEKFNYLEGYRKTFSEPDFLERTKKNINDLENFLDILSSGEDENNIKQEIIQIRNALKKNNNSEEIESFFNEIYTWDAFAIPYSTFGDQYGIAWGLDQGTRDFGQLHGLDKGSEEINRLGKKQEPLMDEKNSFKQKEEFFKNANQEYINSLGLLLGTGGNNTLPRDRESYEAIKNKIKLDDFLEMPYSDIYPAVLQKVLLPFYLKDLYQEVCGLVGKKSLDHKIRAYIPDLMYPSGLAKLGAAFTNNNNNKKKIESLENISKKVNSLRDKFNALERQIAFFQTKKQDELAKIASEFFIVEDFHKVNNVSSYSHFTMSDQDKWFMNNN